MDYSRSANIKARRENASNKEKIKNKVGIMIFRIFIAVVLIGGFAAAGTGVGMYMGIIKNAPSVDIYVQPNIYTSLILDAKTGEQVDQLTGEENRIYVTSDKIPENLKNALVAIEDERFYSHNGVDPQGMLRAIYTIIQTKGQRTEGASTITQQLIKNNILKRSSNTITSKLQEQYMAVEYEKELTAAYGGNKRDAKDHILEVYLNTINLGHGYYGVETAAANYFGKSVSDLTLSECAVLAAITQNPSKNTPDSHPDNNKQRATLVLNKMLELGMITQQQHDDAEADDVYARIAQTVSQEQASTSAHSYFVDATIEELSKELRDQKGLSPAEASNMIYNGGLQIYITQDASMQKIVDDAMMDDRNFPSALYKIDVQYYLTAKNTVTGVTTNYSKEDTVDSSDEVQPMVDAWRASLLGPNDEATERLFTIPEPQAAMVIMDYHTGQIKAITGGRGQKTDDRTFDRATDALRQPGSVFKILASYAPAMDMGKITPYTILVDEPFTYNGYTPHNWWGDSYKGPQTVRQAIIQSMNILAVKNMINTGIDNCFDYLHSFGFTTLVDYDVRDGKVMTDRGPATALGGLTDGVTVLETTAAYGAIANSGTYIQPIFYTKVLNHDGDVLIDHETPTTHQVLKKSTAYMLTNIMEGVITDPNGTGHAAAFANSQIPIAGKTGTTSATKDLTFVGYTPYYVAGIWGGYDLPETMEGANNSFHIKLWSKIMNAIHENLPYRDFSVPASMETVSICEDSGMLATDLCYQDPRGSRVIQAVLPSDEVPTDYCNEHVAVRVDTSTDMRAGQYCPPEYVQTRVGILVNDSDYDGSYYEIPMYLYNGQECTYHNAWTQLFPTVTPIPTQGDGTQFPTVDFPFAGQSTTTGQPSAGPSELVPTVTPVPQVQNQDQIDGLYGAEPSENPIPATQVPQPETPVNTEPASVDDFNETNRSAP